LVEGVVAFVGDGFHRIVAEAAGAVEDRTFVEGEQAIHIGAPVIERQLLAFLGAQLGLFEKDDDEAVEGVDFVMR